MFQVSLQGYPVNEMKRSSDNADLHIPDLIRDRKISRVTRLLLLHFVTLLSFWEPLIATAQAPAAGRDSPTALEEQFKAAVASYQEHQFVQAAAELEKLAQKVPRSFQVQELLGLAYGAQAQSGKAVEHLQTAVVLNPTSVVARTNLATGLLREGKSKEAEVECRKAIELDPSDYAANRTLAVQLLSEDKISDALPLLEAAQKIQPDSYDNGYDLALAYLLSGKLPEARQHAKVLVLQKDSGELHTLLGRIEEKDGRYIDAANEFALAAHQDPSEDNLFAWGSELLLHRTYEPAIEVFRQASRRYPASPRLWIGLGMALYSRGEYEEAISSLLTAADLNPKDPHCYLFLSKAYLSSPNQAQKVIDRFRRYSELEPESALAQFYYAMSLWKGLRVDHPDVDFKAVETLLRKSSALDGTIAATHLQLGILYNDEHLYEKSFPEYKRALELEPALADAHFRLGRYYLRVGEKDKAQAEFAVFQALQAKHQGEIDKERAEVQQFVISANMVAPSAP